MTLAVCQQDGRVRVVSDRRKEGAMLSESLAVLLTSSTWCSWHGGLTEWSGSTLQSFESWTVRIKFLQIAYSDATNTAIYFKKSKCSEVTNKNLFLLQVFIWILTFCQLTHLTGNKWSNIISNRMLFHENGTCKVIKKRDMVEGHSHEVIKHVLHCMHIML